MTCSSREGCRNARLGAFVTAYPDLIATLALALLSLVGCKHEKSVHESGQPAERVRNRPVLFVSAGEEAGPSNGYSGKIEARHTTNVGFRLLGRIVGRHVNLGDTVSKGQLLGTLDVAELMVAVRNAEAALAIAQAEEENAVSNYRRQAALLKKKAIAQAEYDQSKRAEEAAKSAVIQAKSALDKAHEVLGYAELRSDMEGVVTGVYAEIGETVAAGAIVFSIADPGQREAVIDVNAEMLSSINLASEFQVFVPPINHACVGKVREIAPQADIRTRTIRIRIALDDPPESFRLGSTVRAFPAASFTSPLRLPSTAILDRDGDTFVWVVGEPNSQVHLVAVTISDRTENDVIISSGIKHGDRVVVAGVHSLRVDPTTHVPTGASHE